MSVEFPEEKFDAGGNDYVVKKTPTMVKWVMKTGIAKDEKQANIILIVIAVLFLALSLYIFANMGSKPKGTAETVYIEDIPEEELQTIPPEIRKTIPSRYDE